MLVFRWVLLLLLLGGIGCFAMYIGTREVRWRARGLRLVTWTLVAAFGFFAVLFLERTGILP